MHSCAFNCNALAFNNLYIIRYQGGGHLVARQVGGAFSGGAQAGDAQRHLSCYGWLAG